MKRNKLVKCSRLNSAWLAARHEAGELAPGETWTVESVIGSRFEGRVRIDDGGRCRPTIRGRASIVAEGVIAIDPDDPFPEGIPR